MSRTKADILNGVLFDYEQCRIAAPNTLKFTLADGSVVFRLHDTNIVIVKDGIYTLNSGGWRTITIKGRINDYAPTCIRQQNSIWYIGGIEFFDGIQIDSKGHVISDIPEPKEPEIKAMKKRIAKYLKAFDALKEIPRPNSGDCWYCSMQDVKTGKPLGDASNNHGHLLTHMDENYFPGSLLYNAIAEKGYPCPACIFDYPDSIKLALRSYLNKRLLTF